MRLLLLTFSISCCLPRAALGDIVCPDSSYVLVEFSKTYSGAWRTGEPYDYVTLTPDGQGDTFADTGISIDVYLRDASGDPVAGLPAAEVVLVGPGCLCEMGNEADSATNDDGHTTFSGSVAGGGVSPGTFELIADGVSLGQLADANGIAVKWNSLSCTFGCNVDSSHLSCFSSRLGGPHDIYFDYNESGFVDSGDLAFLARHLGAYCDPQLPLPHGEQINR